MSFGDGQSYTQVDLVRPGQYAPLAPHTADCYRTALIQGYVAGRWNARLVLQQLYPQNFQRRDAQRAVPDTFVTSSWTRIAEGFRFLPPAVTHLTAEVQFMTSSTADAIGHARITAHDPAGGTLDVGLDSPVRSSYAARFGATVQRTGGVPQAIEASNMLNPYALYLVRGQCRVTLKNVVTGRDVEVLVEGYGTDTATNPVSYSPISVSVWWECV